MKAILVIDIDGSLIEGNERFAVDGYLMQEADCDGCYEAVGYIKNAPLKPMPNKRVPDGSETDQIYGCYVGWNACIDEILGENNESDPSY